MQTLTAIDIEALATVAGGQLKSLPLAPPDLPNLKTDKVCSNANGTYARSGSTPGGTWKTHQCVDVNSGVIDGGYDVLPRAKR
jgi:hypothetical protein